jgi:hypothetical protein
MIHFIALIKGKTTHLQSWDESRIWMGKWLISSKIKKKPTSKLLLVLLKLK